MTSRRGDILVDGERASISFERRLPYPIEAVWSAITESDDLACWLGAATIEKRQGGQILIEAGPDKVPVEVRRVTGRVLVWEPPHSVEYEWKQAIIEESTVRFDLASDGEGTILKLTHRWLSERNARGFAPGWHSYLDRLDAHLAGAAVPDWEDRYAAHASEYGWA